MQYRNNGNGESYNVQNRFTAYLVTAVQRQRAAYINKKNQVIQMEHCLVEVEEGRRLELSEEQDFTSALPLFMRLENRSLIYGLKQLNDKERYVFHGRVLDGKSFEELAAELGLSYKGTASIYYRSIQKIKSTMREKDE